MDRKNFIKKACSVGAASAAALMTAQTSFAQTQEKKDKEMSDPTQQFKEEWIQAFLKNLDSQCDEKSRIRLMESCGRDCARRGAIRLAESSGGEVDRLVAKLAGHIGKENVKRNGNIVDLVYNECFCPLVAKGPARLSATYCNCSRGWVLELFETVTGKPVIVECLSSIKRGDAKCQFRIELT